MSGRFLLDTNIVIALFGRDSAVAERLGDADEVFVTSVTLGELYFGARKSSRAPENLARVDEFAAVTMVLDCDLGTAREYGLIKDRLRAAGHPIPENDIWIAAVARQHQLVLVSRDDHFRAVEDLRFESW